jgi:hypothetical protein
MYMYVYSCTYLYVYKYKYIHANICSYLRYLSKCCPQKPINTWICGWKDILQWWYESRKRFICITLVVFIISMLRTVLLITHIIYVWWRWCLIELEDNFTGRKTPFSTDVNNMYTYTCVYMYIYSYHLYAVDCPLYYTYTLNLKELTCQYVHIYKYIYECVSTSICEYIQVIAHTYINIHVYIYIPTYIWWQI